MPTETRVVAPGPTDRTVISADGKKLQVPDDWALLPPGDAGVTRRVKSRGPTWTVKEKKGRRMFSRGVWARADRIETVKKEFEVERSTPAYQKRRAADAKRRDQKQSAYVQDFEAAVFKFLAFDHHYESLAHDLAMAVSAHATPVGSGTVARTERIPIERRAESAVIAWMRHQTTAYDNMKIARVKGKRREVRRMLAERSRELLDCYRKGEIIDSSKCLLAQALKR